MYNMKKMADAQWNLAVAEHRLKECDNYLQAGPSQHIGQFKKYNALKQKRSQLLEKWVACKEILDQFQREFDTDTILLETINPHNNIILSSQNEEYNKAMKRRGKF